MSGRWSTLLTSVQCVAAAVALAEGVTNAAEATAARQEEPGTRPVFSASAGNPAATTPRLAGDGAHRASAAATATDGHGVADVRNGQAAVPGAGGAEAEVDQLHRMYHRAMRTVTGSLRWRRRRRLRKWWS